MRRVPWSAVALLLAGCKGCAEDTAYEPAFDVVSADPVGVVVGSAVGGSVPVFATNELGGAVGGSLTAMVDDQATDVSLDAFGWGTVEVAVDGHRAASVRATAGAASAEGWAFGFPTVGLGFDRALPTRERATHVAAAGDGVAWAEGSVVQWAPGDDTPSVPVLDLGEPIAAMEAVAVDADGVQDLLVYGDSTVALLRGRQGGGLVWGAGFRLTSEETLGAAGVDDVDGDVDSDLMFIVNSDTSGRVVLATQSDSWTFTEAESFDLGFQAYGVSAQDYDRSGAAELTVVSGDGLIRRYGEYDGSWVSATSYDITVGISTGARMPASRDLTGDGEDDVLIAGPQSDGKSQAYVLSLATGAVLYPLYATDSRPDALGFDFAEVTGDGTTDVFLVGGAGLTLAAWRSTNDPATFFTRDTPLNVAADGVAVAELSGDGLIDAVVIEDALHELVGATSADVAWSPDPETGQLFDFSLASVPLFTDIDADGVPDVVALRDDGAQVAILHGRAADDNGSETFAIGPGTDVGAYGSVVDFATCDASVYLLMDDGGARRVYAYTVEDDFGLTELWSQPSVADHVLCGGDGTAVTVAEDGDVATYASDGVVTPGAPVEGPVADAATMDDDGIATCASAGCQVLAADLDGDGADDTVTVDLGGATETMIRLADGVELAVPAHGRGWVGDADGDGIADLVVATAGSVQVWRVASDQLAPASARIYARPAIDGAAYGDLDLDGVPDLFVFGSEGELAYARSR